jgi:hypothetical protein
LKIATIPPLAAGSRKTHGAAGPFDIDLLAGNPAIECRSGGASKDYQIVLTFSTAVTFSSATVSPGSGGTASLAGAPITSGNQVTVNLTNVSNAQKITVSLLGVNDGTNTYDVSIQMAMLLGDTNGDGSTNASDVSQTKSRSGGVVSISNFRSDVNSDGNFNSSDVSLVKSNSGTALP